MISELADPFLLIMPSTNQEKRRNINEQHT